METLPSLVLDHIFSYLTLNDKLNCFFVSKSWSQLLQDQFNRQHVLNLCRKIEENYSSANFYGCPNVLHQPTISDHLSLEYDYKYEMSSGQFFAQFSSNINVLHADRVHKSSPQSVFLEALICNSNNNLVCVHLPYIASNEVTNRLLLLLIKHHSKSLKHLLIKSEVTDETLWLIAKNIINLEFLAIHHPTITCEGN